MASIIFTQRGSFKKTEQFLDNGLRLSYKIRTILEKYGQQGVIALASVTPVDTGLTASDWRYTVEQKQGGWTVSWSNSNMADTVPVVILLQYGHGTRGGAYVQGRDIINPAMAPIFESISQDIWKEVNTL